MRLFADYHTHTVFSHGLGTAADNAAAALSRGLTTVGIADHGPANWFGVGIDGLEVFSRLQAEVAGCRRRFPELSILAGTEANIVSYEGDLDVPPSWQNRLDQVLIGFHTYITPKSWQTGWRFISGSLLSHLSWSQRRRARSANTKALTSAIARNRVNIITHPGLKVPIDTVELARASARRGVALEINARHGVRSLDFVRTAAWAGALFAVGSDAHRPSEVGCLEPGLHVARLARLGPDQIINAVPERR